ncbi:glycosyltransferase [Vibrio campbellii]|uniref:glycosyltransferase n=1 Tax=Vibrio campbellii TaxID=680 RepID=UPI00168CCA91|nr:glycosyltransferase [Vibrio campbellii]
MKKCLLVCSSFYPAYKSGGPARSLTNLVSLLEERVEFDVFTSDRDMNSKPFSNINVNSWENLFKSARVFYKSPDISIFTCLKTFKNKKYDCVFLNSFFDFRFSIIFLVLHFFGMIKASEIILAPRGELSHGAMSLKPMKKKLFLHIFKFLGFSKVVTFNFTSEIEAKEAREYLGDVNYKLVPNMHGKIPDFKKKNKKPGELKLIFLSRISEKKNLHVVLETLSQINCGEVFFKIAGVIDDQKYWSRCQNILNFLPSNIHVEYLGAIDQKKVHKELQESHAFFLPTLNENYGHAIVEAMINSNMIIISDQTPWSEVSHHGGIVENLNDSSKYSFHLKSLLALTDEEYEAKARSTYEYCASVLEKNKINISKLFND